MRSYGIVLVGWALASCDASSVRGIQGDGGIDASDARTCPFTVYASDAPVDTSLPACTDPTNEGAGCPCAEGSPPLACDVATGRSSAGPNGICDLGQRSCIASPTTPDAFVWSTCLAWRPPFRYLGAVSACPGSCLPGCQHQLDCPEPGDSIPPGSVNVTLGSLDAAVFCPSGTRRGGITLTPGSDGGAGYTQGTYVLVVDSDCPTGTEINWGQFNYTSSVPAGTGITFIAQTADTLANLSTATPVPLPNAPMGVPGVPSNIDLISNLIAWAPAEFLYAHRYIVLTATLTPSADGRVAPTLGSTEIQFTCGPTDPLHFCVPGGSCYTGSPCRLGTIACVCSEGGLPIEQCIDVGPSPVGSFCGPGAVCSALSVCFACPPGMPCPMM